MAKKLLIFFAIFLVIIGISASLLVRQYNKDLVSSVGAGEAKVFTVKTGDDAEIVADNLTKERLIRSKWSFLVYLRLNNLNNKIQAGTYKIAPTETMLAIINKLTGGEVAKKRVTIREGLTLKKMAPLFEKADIIKEAEFFEAVKVISSEQKTKFDFLKSVPAISGLQGYLFPDTYLFEYGTTASEVVNAMLGNFETKTTGLIPGFKTQGLTLHQGVTLGSMVEAEARDEEQRRTIAGIILNRLRAGMLLQIDATVNFITGRTGSSPTGAELAIDSPYNTYKHVGLPPGPIGAPGLSSLSAVSNPTKTNYFFYCHDKNGKIYYGRNFEEHQRNVPTCLGQ